MFLVIAIDVTVVATLIFIAARKGLEEAIPYLIFFLVLVPEESRIILRGAFDLYTHRVALATLFVLFCIYKKKRSTINVIPFKNLIYLHIAWATTSTLFSIVWVTSAKQLLAQLLEYYLFYYIIVKTITRTSTIIKIVYAMIAAMSVCCVFGLLEIYAGWSVLSSFPTELQLRYGGEGTLYAEMFDRGIRARATFPHPIHFGGALAMTIPLAFYMVTFSKGSLKKMFINVALLLMFWNLYKTGSRGPWLATACGMAILTFAADARIRKRIIAVAVLAMVIVIARPGIGDTLWNMYRGTMDPNSMMGSSFEYRPVLFHTVMKTLNDNPERAALGFGLGSFREKGLVLEMPGITSHRWYTCDSTWILFAYETGYVGFLILATLLLKPAFLILRNFGKLPKSRRQLLLAFFSSLAAFYVVMISVAIYSWGQNGYMLWTVISISVAYLMLEKAELRRCTMSPKPERWEMTVSPSWELPSGRVLPPGSTSEPISSICTAFRPRST